MYGFSRKREYKDTGGGEEDHTITTVFPPRQHAAGQSGYRASAGTVSPGSHGRRGLMWPNFPNENGTICISGLQSIHYHS